MLSLTTANCEAAAGCGLKMSYFSYSYALWRPPLLCVCAVCRYLRYNARFVPPSHHTTTAARDRPHVRPAAAAQLYVTLSHVERSGREMGRGDKDDDDDTPHTPSLGGHRHNDDDCLTSHTIILHTYILHTNSEGWMPAVERRSQAMRIIQVHDSKIIYILRGDRLASASSAAAGTAAPNPGNKTKR